MHVSNLSDCISGVTSNTFITEYTIKNEFVTVFDLGTQRLETLKQLEIQYLQALAKPERQTILQNRLSEALIVSRVSDCLSSLVSLSLQSAL